jgi:2-C-methyl-D-erythritol 4-phosphate cytidylyltransferase/2-C-methyl-D-erythritol 2,4-cyclodiphosphate synthase
MQTPQAAHHSVIAKAYSESTGEFTDEMALMESVGIQPTLVDGDPRNFKVTTPDDLLRAQAYVGYPEYRTGMGYDIHPVATDGRPLMLGGVRFEGPGLDGHSDADVVLHAVTDALLGGAAMGDIGEHFPNTDPQWRGAPSVHFLEHAANLLRNEGWQIVNIDISVVAEFPKIMPKALEIRQAIGGATQIEPARISIKATTNEKLGAIGRSEGIAAFAVATLRRFTPMY